MNERSDCKIQRGVRRETAGGEEAGVLGLWVNWHGIDCESKNVMVDGRKGKNEDSKRRRKKGKKNRR